jgi:hypothetical protein
VTKPVIIVLLLVSSAFANVDVAKAKPATCALTDAESAGLNRDASTDVNALSEYSDTAYRMLKAGRTEQLECVADSVRTSKATFAGGMWKIHALYNSLSRPPLHPTHEDWLAHVEMVERWGSERPQSITARIALAESYINWAADARGTGLGDTVSESGWKLLAERIAKAKQILDNASTLSTKDPEWYVAMQDVALLDWEPAARHALLDQAVKFEPNYYYYYRKYANSILPQWGGEQGEVAEFLQKSADQIGGEAGDGLYFRVANSVLCGCAADQNLKLSWLRILKGFNAVERQSGPSMENLNLLAHMAVSFNDPMVANTAFNRIGAQWSKDVWQTSSYFASSKEWAKQADATVARNRIAEEAAETNLHTPEGQRYAAAFAEKIRTWMQPCTEQLAGADPGTFELLVKVGKEGTLDEIAGSGHSELMPCLGRKLNDFRTSKAAVFPVPPQPDHWVRFDLNPEKAVSLAQK